MLRISWRHFTDFLATFYGFLGDIPSHNVLRFSGLRAVFFFIYFIYIKMILRAFVGLRQRPQHFIFLLVPVFPEREILGCLFPCAGG